MAVASLMEMEHEYNNREIEIGINLRRTIASLAIIAGVIYVTVRLNDANCLWGFLGLIFVN